MTERLAGMSLSTLSLTGWIAGAMIFLIPVPIGLWQVRSSRRSSLPWRHGQLLVERLAHAAGIKRHIDVLLHETSPGPMTCGVMHPAIVLSPEALTWDEEDLNRAIVHELEHIRRVDWLSQCLARALCAFYWFHPLVWIAWRQLTLEAERACDDAVLLGSEATTYADQLVGLAKRRVRTSRSPLPAMANRADLATRVGALLDTRQRRGRAGLFLTTLVCGGAAVLVIALSPLIVVAAPQSVPAARPEFDAASVKPNKSDERMNYGLRGDRIVGKNIPVIGWIQIAYGVKDFQIRGPGWISTEKFDIEAKAVNPSASATQMMLMLQSLLADRFKLGMRREMEDSPVYALVVDRRGLRMKPSKDQTLWAGDYPDGSPDGRPLTGGGPTELAPGRFKGEAIPITMFVNLLSGPLARPVVNRTGLSGRYDIDLRYAPGSGRTTTDADQVAVTDASTPSLFTAMQEQLGLRLESARAPVEVFVVDHIERPSQN